MKSVCNVGLINVITSELKWSIINFDGIKVVFSDIVFNIFKINCLNGNTSEHGAGCKIDRSLTVQREVGEFLLELSGK